MAKKINNYREQADIIQLAHGKIPPQAVDMEEVVLGALMLEADAIEIVYNILEPQSFYKSVHQTIYSAIVSLYAENKSIDILTVTNELRKMDRLDEVGGPFYVTQLTSKVGSAAHIEEHSMYIAQAYYKREMIRMASEMERLSFDDTLDIGDLIEFAGSEYQKLSDKVFGSKKTMSFSEIVNLSVSNFYERKQLFEQGKVTGVKTPIRKLTIMTGGFQNGDLIILAARPSMGKSAFMISMAETATENDETDVALFSLEMKNTSLVDRVLCGVADIDPEKYRAGSLNDSEIMKLEEAAGFIHKRGIYIDDKSNPTILYIKNRARILKKQSVLANKKFLVMIDYLQLVDAVHEKGKLREQEVAEISKAAKGIAKDLDCPVVVLAQLNRACELRQDKRPILSDLRESGAIEQDADLVLFMYRDWYYKIEEDEAGKSTEGKGEIHIAKQRNGRIGPVFFGHNPSLTRIFDYYREDPISGSGPAESWINNFENSKNDDPF
jgi:replicative DNA helicase